MRSAPNRLHRLTGATRRGSSPLASTTFTFGVRVMQYDDTLDIWRWEPTPRVIEGDGSRSHWAKRKDRTLRSCRRLVHNLKLAWLETAPPSEDENGQRLDSHSPGSHPR